MDADETRALDGLAAQLTTGKYDEHAKASALFRWLASQNLLELNIGDVEEGSSNAVLYKLKKKDLTYSQVYEKLCNLAGLDCEMVRGFAKAASYRPGQEVGDGHRHSWNAVKVKDTWLLVDCGWAAMSYQGKVDVDTAEYRLDEYYFGSDPEEFIYSHFPDEEKWQLLKKAITQEKFEKMTMVKNELYKVGLLPEHLSCRDAVITTKDGNVSLTVAISHRPDLVFLYQLHHWDGRDMIKQVGKDVKLDRFVLMDMQGTKVLFTMRLPEKGDYEFSIYAKDSKLGQGATFPIVCKYKIECTKNPGDVKPYPQCSGSSWGPTDTATKYNIKALQDGTIFKTKKGFIELRFRSERPLNYNAKLKDAEKEDVVHSGCSLLRTVDDGLVAIITVRPPAAGEYGLEIWAGGMEPGDQYLYRAFQFLIICSKVEDSGEEWPTLPPAFLGARGNFTNYGLSFGHPDPYLVNDDEQAEVWFKTSQPMQWSAKLHLFKGADSTLMSSYVLRQSDTNRTSFVCRFPRPGMYTLEVYAMPKAGTEGQSLPNVYNCLINCQYKPGKEAVPPFPLQYSAWGQGCYLHKPMDGKLKAGDVDFRVTVPDSKDVAIIIGGKWTHLKQEGDIKWKGTIKLDKSAENNKVQLASKSGAGDKFGILLEFDA